MNAIAFDRPACYQISIMGVLDSSWSDRLGGMAIATASSSGGSVTSLTGELLDQSALAGVLATLHELGFTLLRVELVPKAAGA